MRFGFEYKGHCGEIVTKKGHRQALLAMMVRDTGRVYGRETHLSIWMAREIPVDVAEDLVFDTVERCAFQSSLLLSMDRQITVLN